jgi:hypothetical protein
MTAFEYMSTLGVINHVWFERVSDTPFVLFTLVSNIGPWRDEECIITEHKGEVRICEMPASCKDREMLRVEPKRLLSLKTYNPLESSEQ